MTSIAAPVADEQDARTRLAPDRPVGARAPLRGTLVLVVLLAGGTAALSGCTSATGSAAPAPTATPAAGGASTSAPADGPTGTATRPADPLATDVPTVSRTDAPAGRVSAGPASFSSAAKYSDGLSVAVTKVAEGTSVGNGPGSFAGAPLTTLTVTVTNGSSAPVVLNQVVVTMSYGSPRRVAAPVYQPGAMDFSGTVQPGAGATATYLFAVPADGLSDATLAIDLDGTHSTATFSGPVHS